jgi:phosphate transport system permease protein
MTGELYQLTPKVQIFQDLKKKPNSRRSVFNVLLTATAAICLLVTLIPLGLVLTFVLIQGFKRLDFSLFTQLPPPPGSGGGGIANAILGTLMVVSIATLISLPFGIMAAVYLSEFSAKNPSANRLARGVNFATNVLSGVPSIISGVFVYGLLVKTGLTGFSAIAGGVALAVLMLPTVVRTADEAMEIVPAEVRQAAYSVGASRYQVVLAIVLPAAMPGIITGVMLGIARAAGETAPLIFTALSSNFWPQGLLQPLATLSVVVYNFAIVPFQAQQQLAWAGAMILVMLVLITSILARLATRQNIY